MAEIGGVTELELLEVQIAIAERQLAGVQKAEKTSAACARVAASIQGAEESDNFVGGAASNQYHSSAAPSDGGCCTVS